MSITVSIKVTRNSSWSPWPAGMKEFPEFGWLSQIPLGRRFVQFASRAGNVYFFAIRIHGHHEIEWNCDDGFCLQAMAAPPNMLHW